MQTQKACLLIEGEPLASHTTLGIGGAARYFAQVNNSVDLCDILEWAKSKDIPVYILGKGSNVLFDDRGFDGLVIVPKLSGIEFNEIDMSVRADAGVSFARLSGVCSQKGWSGLEFAIGIPGTVGGAIYMNAGASGSDTASTLAEVLFLDHEGKIHRLTKEELSFSYRHSSFQKKTGVILQGKFVLNRSVDAKEKLKKILASRIASQPYDQKSAGCIFRNPSQGNIACKSAGALIDEAGLKGFAVGDIEVSTLHANFFINKGNGTAAQLLDLVKYVQEQIVARHNVELMTEVIFVPYKGTSWWNNHVAR